MIEGETDKKVRMEAESESEKRDLNETIFDSKHYLTELVANDKVDFGNILRSY